MTTFKPSIWERSGNHLILRACPNVQILQWNTGKKATFAVEAGWRSSTKFFKTIPGTGPEAKERAIELALSLVPKYKPELTR